MSYWQKAPTERWNDKKEEYERDNDGLELECECNGDFNEHNWSNNGHEVWAYICWGCGQIKLFNQQLDKKENDHARW